jgi:hypothetical protein
MAHLAILVTHSTTKGITMSTSETDGKSTVMHIRVPRQLYRDIAALARETGLPTATMAKVLLTKSMKSEVVN